MWSIGVTEPENDGSIFEPSASFGWSRLTWPWFGSGFIDKVLKVIKRVPARINEQTIRLSFALIQPLACVGPGFA